MINVWRVKARVESGGHDVPEEKIIARYDKALALVKDLVKVAIFAIYMITLPVDLFAYLRSGKNRYILMSVMTGIMKIYTL